MPNGLSIKVVGLSLSALFAVTYVVCVAAAARFGGIMGAYGWGMMGAIGTGMMGATGSAAGLVGFILGLVWTVIVAFYIAIVFVPVYNFLQCREASQQAARLTTQPVSAHN
jgi:hypothetical protein